MYTSDGTGAGNSAGRSSSRPDGGTLLAFRNSVSGGAAPQVGILQSVDGFTWTTAYNISEALGDGYGRSGMPLRDDNGDIYWPLASGGAHAPGGLLKRTARGSWPPIADGAWSVVLSEIPSIRGPIGIVRARDAVIDGPIGHSVQRDDSGRRADRLLAARRSERRESRPTRADTATTARLIGGVTLNQIGAVPGDRAMAFDGVVTVGSKCPPRCAFELSATAAPSKRGSRRRARCRIGGVLEKTIGGVVNTSYSLLQ